jgi:MFS family permease
MGGVNAGLFIKPMTEELGIGQAYFGWAQTARLLAFTASGWFIGHAIDKRGARIPLALAGLTMGVVMVGQSFVTAGWQIVVLFFVAGLTGLAGTGGNLYVSVPLSRWFIRNRGRAMALAFLGTPLGIFFFAPFTQYLIDEFGWRSAWLVLGVGGSSVIAFVALLMIRRSPEDMGLLADGRTFVSESNPGRVSEVQSGAPDEYSWGRAEAVRTSTFWRLAFVDGLRMVAVSTLGLFRIPYYVERGIDPGIVALALSAEAIVGIFVAIPVGWALDRFAPRFVSAFSTTAMIAAFVATILVSTPAHVFAATILYGIAAVSFNISQNAIWPHYFGGMNIGQIRGVSMILGVSASAFGAPATGMIRDTTGTFVPAWIGAIIALAMATLIVAFLPRPRLGGAHRAGSSS